MGILVKDGGIWKDSEPYARDAGIWKPVDTGFVKDGGVWKEMFSSGPPAIGEPYEGGYYAGLIKVGAVTYALIVAPKSLGGETPGTLEWGSAGTSIPGASSVNDGWANTQAMAVAGLSNHPAAQFCRGLTIGGYSDWYLPSKDELEILYRSFKPSTTLNNTQYGANPSSVPPQSYYTSSVPAQTSFALFKAGAGEDFKDNNYYWSSTEYGYNSIQCQHFSHGVQSMLPMGYGLNVRAIRRVPI